MKTYEVSIRTRGAKRIVKTYTIHANTASAARTTAMTQFAEENESAYNLHPNWISEAKQI